MRAQSSSLSIVSEQEPFILYLNSVNVSMMANTVAVVEGLKIGKNHVRLDFKGKGVPQLNAQIDLANDGKLHQLSYKVVKDSKGKYILQFIADNTMAIVGYDEQPAEEVDLPKKSKEPEKKNEKTPPSNTNKSGGVSGNIQTPEGNANVKVAVSQSGTIDLSLNVPDEPQQPASGKSDQQKMADRVPKVSNGLMCNSPSVDGQTFLKFKYKISGVSMEMYKARDIKDFMSKQCMLASQVADLVKIIQMNDYQYDVAQFGYLHTYDQSNYGLVVNAFMADFNREKLLNFIGTNQSIENSVVVSGPVESAVSNQNNNEKPVQPPTKESSNYNNSGSSYSNTCIPMESEDFEEALAAVDEPINEDNKMEVAKSVFDQECLNTNQVYQVMELFINEDRKLTFAKFAFQRTSDRDKYFRLNKAFIDEGRITDLSNFVKKNR